MHYADAGVNCPTGARYEIEAEMMKLEAARQEEHLKGLSKKTKKKKKKKKR